MKNNRVLNISNNVLKFLEESEISNWEDFKKMGKFDYDIIDNLILHEAKDSDEVDEIKFIIRIRLSNKNQLETYLKELEYKEEYERCQIIIKEMKNLL